MLMRGVGEADKGGYRGAGIGAPGAHHVGEHVVVRVLEGDAPLLSLRISFGHRHVLQAPASPNRYIFVFINWEFTRGQRNGYVSRVKGYVRRRANHV